MDLNEIEKQIFNIPKAEEFEALALKVFNFQYQYIEIYQQYCNYLGKHPTRISRVMDIPHLPIQFFKSHTPVFPNLPIEETFTSSGTTGQIPSKHLVVKKALYEESFTRSFEAQYGPIEKWCILALLPNYLQRKGSSLVYMAQKFIEKSEHHESGFYLNDLNKLSKTVKRLEKEGTKTLLLGVSYALLDLAEQFPMELRNTLVMETGGMKGRRKEMIREELHSLLKQGLGVTSIHSEYGMTELLSQAYAKKANFYIAPPWMKVSIRDTEDPLSGVGLRQTGGINIIDLANLYSCAFIATQDLGRLNDDGSFQVIGRFDQAEVRGCNLMAI